MDSVVEFINDVGATCRGTVGTLLTLNYVAGEAVVSLVRWLCQIMWQVALSLGQAIHIMLEDFGTFLEEIAENVLFAAHGVVTAIEALVTAITDGANGLYMGIYKGVNSVHASMRWSLKIVYDASDWVGKSLYAAASTLFLAVSLIPQMLGHGLWGLFAAFRHLLWSIGEAGRQSAEAVRQAPLQAIVGFVAASLTVYLSYRTAKRLIVERQITTRHVVHWSFQALCLLYVLFVNFNVMIVRGTVRLIEFTLTHLHVPRFHQAGDSDQEDEADPDVIPAEVLDDSDAEEGARVAARQRTYNLLIKRRDERRKRRSKSKNNPRGSNAVEEEVEDLLLQQVEREREDKLCVICQDREKCIMILPCRHLCICQDCQVSLMQRTDQAHSRTCPICRKNVKQTIKAYL